MKTTSKTTALTLVCLASIAMLAGCANERLVKGVNEDVAAAPISHIQGPLLVDGAKGTAKDIAARATKAQSVMVVRNAPAPWIGGAFTPTTNEDALPALFSENYNLDFGDGRVSLQVLAARLTKMTGVPVRVRGDVYATGTGASSTTSTSMPTPLPTSTKAVVPSGVISSAVSSTSTVSIDGVAMQWSGNLRGFLNHLTNTLNLSWEYRDGAVVIMKNITQNYLVAGMVGEQSYSTSSGGSSSGSAGQSGGASNNLNSNSSFSEKGSLDAFGAITKTITAMVGTGPGLSVLTNTQTGSISVTAPKEVQAQVRDYLDEQNKLMRLMVNVTMDIYTVKDSDGDSKGLDWNLVFNTLANDYGVKFSSPTSLVSATAGQLTLTSLAGQGAGTTAVLSALNQTGKSVQHKPISLVTMNGKIKVQSSTNTQGYVKETTPGLSTGTGAAGAPGLKTDTITTGDIYSVLPIVQPDNSVLLKYSFRLSNLIGITNFTSGTGAAQQTVQVPQTDSVDDSTDIRLMPGETVMITGLSRMTSSVDDKRLSEGAFLGFGGSTASKISREHLIVLLRATPF